MIAKGDYTYVILMVLVGVSQFAQFRISNKINQNRTKAAGGRQNKQSDMMNRQMQMMTYFFPLMMMFIAYNLSSAMSLYLTTSALISIAQSLYIEKRMENNS
ncbi:MAG: YidC/Oxa1 family membrane protein insertase, partial [Bacilli bacterium]